MANTNSRVTIHMVASLDGFIARRDGRVDWLETSDKFEDGDTMAPEFVEEFLKTIDCYVMGSRTYETALEFEAKVRLVLRQQANLHPHQSRAAEDQGYRRVLLRRPCAAGE
jgi:dihydrofolate reductase